MVPLTYRTNISLGLMTPDTCDTSAHTTPINSSTVNTSRPKWAQGYILMLYLHPKHSTLTLGKLLLLSIPLTPWSTSHRLHQRSLSIAEQNNCYDNHLPLLKAQTFASYTQPALRTSILEPHILKPHIQVL